MTAWKNKIAARGRSALRYRIAKRRPSRILPQFLPRDRPLPRSAPALPRG
jgi:hypothetical protein